MTVTALRNVTYREGNVLEPDFSKVFMSRKSSAYRVDPFKTAKLKVSVPTWTLADLEDKLA